MNHRGPIQEIERIVLILLLLIALGSCGQQKEPESENVRSREAVESEYLLERRPGIDEGTARLTGYYVAEVKKRAEHGEGVAVRLTYLDGRTATRYFPEDVVRVADMEAVVTRVDE